MWLKDWDVIKEKIAIQEEDLEGFLELLNEGHIIQTNEEDDETKIVKEIFLSAIQPF